MRDKVLVIEDEPVIGEMMCILLEIEGYKVISLSDTASAMRKLKNEEVALVMLDLNLAGEDGQQVCRYIKEQPDLKHTPVVLVSASPDLPQIKDKCGADDYLSKPFELPDFVEKVKRFTGSSSNVA
ncbi:response regulator [Mucilaginibacter achroorhodeus]|uniref:Response regulator n=1 Tax=Mucilaginibacter achroorhodeus TaxID=2599294 RepID=A0A563U182_9SPHI|nr:MULTISPECIES: response regulator [Mucilaginibacter]QXV65278.1 response regulator [Mucilaginibacter sp. 21P]TWR24611.1 response regulator [Mucilaginibacter achroorhodeus]